MEKVIKTLESAKGPSRSLDFAIGLALGWRKVVSPSTADPAKTVTIWHRPGTAEIATLPLYTTNLQHAMELAVSVAPKAASGCSWEEDGKGTARIAGGPYFQACNPQIALVLAALHHLRSKQDG